MNEQGKKWYGIVAAAVVIIAALGWYFSYHNKAAAPSGNNGGLSVSTTTPGAATSTSGASGGVQVGAIADTGGIPMPNLNRPYTPPSNLPASVQADDKKAVADAIAQLKIDPNHLAYWLQLAIYRKGANDYAGAEEIWLYCTKRWPTDFTAFEDLGDLYANYMHESAQAVEYWNKAIAIAPKHTYNYINLATFQDINMHDKAAAQATLQAGLKANPGNADLQYALDHLQ
jgi:hypothetical protein